MKTLSDLKRFRKQLLNSLSDIDTTICIIEDGPKSVEDVRWFTETWTANGCKEAAEIVQELSHLCGESHPAAIGCSDGEERLI